MVFPFLEDVDVFVPLGVSWVMSGVVTVFLGDEEEADEDGEEVEEGQGDLEEEVVFCV